MKLDALDRWDCDLVRLWRNDEPQFLRTPYILTQEMQEDFYKNVICNRDSPHRYFGIYDRSMLMGMGGLTNIEWENGCCEISLIMNPKFRGKGLGRAAANLLFDHAILSMRMVSVYGEVYECGNFGFWKKLVDEHEGYWTRLKGRKYHQGVMYDSFWFSIGLES